MVKKYLISDRFDFLERFFSRFLIIPYELFYYLVEAVTEFRYLGQILTATDDN